MNARNTIQSGIRFEQTIGDLSDSLYQQATDAFIPLTSFDGSTWLLQPYVSWKHRFNERITLNAGLHYQYLGLNGDQALEPWAGLKYQFSEKDALSIGYGLHSLTPPIATFFSSVEVAPGVFEQPNEDIRFVRAHHLVLGYDRSFTESLRLKAEVYYQSLFDVLVEEESSSFSTVNYGSLFSSVPDYLVNNGTATNYGFEFTLEQFLNKGFYFLFTTSIYESLYKGSDGIERQSAFSGNYVVNGLLGKEFRLPDRKSSGKPKFIVIDTRLTAAGGQRYTPSRPHTRQS